MPDRDILIEALRWTYGEFLADPAGPQFSDADRPDFPWDIGRWLEAGMFVFAAGGDDYRVDADGAVVSS